jgi:hypothetical protein
LAWNGIRFQAPSSWHPAQIGKQYLLLESSDQPVFELRWSKVKGRFSHKSNLKRLGRERNRRGIPEFKRIELPDAWQKALSAFNIQGFSWRSRNLGGTGVLAYCSTCRTASLIQFFHHRDAPDDALVERLLKSYQDHQDSRLVRFALFDVSAEIPEKYKLDWYGFDTGRFEMGFSWRKRQMVLNRYAPASALLGREGLAEFAQRYMVLPDGNKETLDDPVSPAVEWTARPRGRLNRLLFRGFSIKGRVWRLRLTHNTTANRILAVHAQGTAPPLTGEFEHVIDGFSVTSVK